MGLSACGAGESWGQQHVGLVGAMISMTVISNGRGSGVEGSGLRTWCLHFLF